MKGYIDGTYPVRVDSTIYGLTDPNYLRVKLAAASLQSADPSLPPLVTLAGAGDEHFGVLVSIPFYADTSGNRNANDAWTVRLANAPGSTSFIAAGAVVYADLLYGAASGKVSNTPSGRAIAVAMCAASGSGSEVEGLAIGPNKFSITREILAASVSNFAWRCDRPARCVGVNLLNDVVSTSGTLAVRKNTSAGTGRAGDSAGATIVEQLTTALDLSVTPGSAGTKLSGTLSATASDLIWAIGDWLALKFGGTMTGLVGAVSVDFVGLPNQ